ncbi:MAG TPA: hypothetical protein VEF89_22605 [Solirubrobacteraceae bacterium]|nr:hypothetical protein [Solirubrobacteraceae bacterium]
MALADRRRVPHSASAWAIVPGGGGAPEFLPKHNCELTTIGGLSADRGERPGFGDEQV